MKLKTIREKIGNPEYTLALEKEISLIKKKCNLKNTDVMYFLGHYMWHEMFLCKEKLYVACVFCEYDDNKHKIISTMDFNGLYKITLHKDYPKALKDITFEPIIIKDPRNTFTPDNFFDWIDMPSEINTEVDLPYYEVIKFLNSYAKETFRTNRYLFYSKWDGDSNFVTNIYACDIKNQTELKIYIPDKWQGNKIAAPSEVKDLVVDDLSGKLSNYQKLQCKKDFLNFANEINPTYELKNYWLMELAKLAVQPIDELHEWSIHRIFCNRVFNNIWVYDFPDKDEEPYFMIIDEWFTKVAVIDFKSPTYHIKGIYKRGNVKAKKWKLDKSYILDLIAFLNAPSDRINDEYYQGSYKKYIKTNWQQLIFEYNHNTAGWSWGDTGFDVPPEKDTGRVAEVEVLPFDLSIPDYTELLNDKG